MASVRIPGASVGVLGLVLVLGGCTSGAPEPRAASPSVGGSPASPSADVPGEWLSYHADGARTGAVVGPSPSGARVAWTADLGGAVRGQPLVAEGRILAATETDRVVALDPRTGHVLWSTSVGAPLTDVAAAVGCGNIDPLGVTSTAVVDPATHTVFVVGEVSEGGGRVHHRLQGLDIATGAVRVSADVDPPLPDGETPLHLLQRASLALGSGRVYVSYGGHIGDCGHYHGWVVAAETADPSHQVSFQVAPDGEGGAIWQSGGAPAIDAAGNVYVSTGNANPDPPEGGPDPKRYAESVVKLSPDLRPLATYKDTTAGGDEDLSTGNPVLLPDGRVFAVGKTQTGFLLGGSDLRLLGRIPGVCGSDPDGGPAYDRAHDRMFVPCRGGGLQVVDLARQAVGPRLTGADSAPIVVGGVVWAVDSQRDVLTAFDAGSGRTLQTIDIGSDVPIFTSPSSGAGLLLVGTTKGVTAFR
jgi:polyvinyl alcohol dehydrogenase (cytochrome)